MLIIPAHDEVVIGVDEVGRGCIAGPVVACAVVWGASIDGLGDSKKISAARRAKLVPLIEQSCAAFSIGHASVEEVDSINILQATFLAMRRAVEALPEDLLKNAKIWVDGNAMPTGFSPDRTSLFIGGDATHAPISAASILAKEWRDAYMKAQALEYPDFGFEKHMGYGTAYHMAALSRAGPCALHRRSFAPVARLISISK